MGTPQMQARLVRARALMLAGCLVAGLGAGILLTGRTFLGLVVAAAAVLLAGGGFSMGVSPQGTLLRRMRQAPGLGLIIAGLAASLTALDTRSLLCVGLGVALLAADAYLVNRSVPSQHAEPDVEPVSDVEHVSEAESNTEVEGSEPVDAEVDDVQSADLVEAAAPVRDDPTLTLPVQGDDQLDDTAVFRVERSA